MRPENGKTNTMKNDKYFGFTPFHDSSCNLLYLLYISVDIVKTCTRKKNIEQVLSNKHKPLKNHLFK